MITGNVLQDLRQTSEEHICLAYYSWMHISLRGDGGVEGRGKIRRVKDYISKYNEQTERKLLIPHLCHQVRVAIKLSKIHDSFSATMAFDFP